MGDTAHASGHAPYDDNSGGARGESALEAAMSKVASKITEQQEKQTTNIRTIAEAVQVLRSDMSSLKRKQEGDGISPKKTRTSSPQPTTSIVASKESPSMSNQNQSQEHPLSDSDSGSEDDDLQAFMDDGKEQDTFSDLEDFFQTEEGTGEEVSAQIARITEKALRGPKSKKDDEKLHELKQKHKRPKNIQNIQVPRVEESLWRQLKPLVKRVDFAQQKAAADAGQATVPLIKALELIQSKQNADTVKTYIMDAFKILSLNIKATNLKRLEFIKRELQPKYKAICPEEPSTTKLLGDDFQESIKKQESAKGSIIVSTQSFLAKKGGDRHQQFPLFNKTYHNQSFNQNRFQPKNPLFSPRGQANKRRFPPSSKK